MKKLYITIFSLFVIHFLSGQSNLVLNQPESGNIVREAENSITLSPGFSYTSNLGEIFIGRIADPSSGNNNLPNYNNVSGNIDQEPDFYGSITGSLDVNGLGGAVYTIPIAIPPGTAGMQPNLSITYNSQSGNGTLGLRWGLGGLSAISRVDKNTYYNDTILSIAYSVNPNDDALALDGVRLVNVDGIYMKITDSSNKITLYGSGIDAWFKVETKDGKILEYGNTNDSKLYAEGKTYPITWCLNKVTDNNGNYMLYTYTTINEESVLEKITYTGNSNTSLSPYNTITFNYKERKDKESHYIAGGVLRQNNILNSMTIECEGMIVKEYILDYLESGFYSRLSSITEKFDDNTLSSLNINWGSFTKQKTNNIEDCNLYQIPLDQIYTGDFDGDGLADILHYESSNWEIYYSGSQERKAIMFPNNQNSDNNEKILIADFNGDGKDEIIIKSNSAWCIVYTLNGETLFDEYWLLMSKECHIITGNFIKNGRQQVLFATGISPIDKKIHYQLSDEEVYCTSYVMETTLKSDKYLDLLFSINIDGNGDHIAVLNSTDKKIEIYNLFSSNNLITTINIDQTDRKRIFSGDTDGDGKDEIIIINDDNLCYIYSYADNRFQLIKQQQLQQFKDYEEVIYDPNSKKIIDIPSKNFEQFIVRDFDGDGKVDILQNMFLYKSAGTFYKYPEKRHGSVCGPIGDMLMPGYPIVPNMFTCYCNPNRLETHTYYYAFQNYSWQLNYKTEKNYAILYSSSGEKTTWELPFRPIVSYGDFDGDGISDFTNGINTFSFSNALNSSDFLVKSITENSLKESININYTYASDKSVHTQETGATFPYNDFAGPMPIVSSVELPNGVGGKSKTEYAYSGLTLHRQGRGFLGFKKITTNNNTQGITNSTYYKETNSNQKSWVPYYTMVSTTDGKKISSVGRTFSYKTYSSAISGRRYPLQYDYMSADTLRNYLTGKYHYSTYEYNDYEDMLSSTTTYSDNGIKQEITNTYEPRISWSPSRLKSSTVKGTYNNITDYIRTTDYTYDDSGNLQTITTDPRKSKALTTTYVYNAYGLPTDITVSAAGQQSRSNTFSYDSKYRSVIGKNNELGQPVSFTYDYKWGVVLTEENTVTGLKTEMKYGKNGQLKEIISPDGNVTRIYKKKADNIAPAYAKYYTLTETPGSPYQKSYYDALGRVIKQETQGFDSKMSVSKSYNSKGQLEKESDPYKSAPESYTNYAYDEFGRVEKVEYQALSTFYLYDKNKTTVSGAGKYRVEITDQLGNVIKTEDYNENILNYNYHGSGQIKTASLGSKELVSCTYDEYGRQETMTDIDAGTMTYVYNAFGELESQTDANGNNFIIKYDNWGRITEKTSSSMGKISYDYYTDTNKAYHGLLKSVSGLDNMKQQYEYDPLGRLITYTDVIQGEEFKTKYGYDSFGNMILTSYPSGFTIENHYNKAGYLYDISNASDSKSIWKMQETDAMGMVKKVLNGNNLATEYKYDSYGMLTGIKTGDIQDLTYVIDPVSRRLIKERKDVKKNMTETFGYDGLERLYSIRLNNGPEKLTEYYDNGNIKSKYDNGVYSYDNQRIHAVTQTTNSSAVSNQTITYNGFNKTATIEQGLIGYEFKYGVDGQRRKMYRKSSGTVNLERTYSANYEKEKVGSRTRETHYIPTPSGLTALFIKENGNAGKIYYLCSDHLGSITAVVDASGNVVESFSYDAWGRRRNAGNWSDYNVTTGSNSLVSRGYTGHEHLDDVGLVNMNGRMYDPLLGRMLSPDNLVPDPFSIQGFNRYSYCYNNPMNFVDSDGNHPLAWIGAGLIYLGKLWFDGKQANQGESNPFKWDWSTANYSVGYSSQGNTVSGGVGWGSDYGIMMGYNFNQGFGFGYNSNGNSNLYYPSYENHVNRAIEQNTNNAFYNARNAYHGAKTWFENHFLFEAEMRFDYGYQVDFHGKVLGIDMFGGYNKGTKPIAQLEFGYKGGGYANIYDPILHRNSYAYNGIIDPVRDRWSFGFVVGTGADYYPSPSLFEFDKMQSEYGSFGVYNLTKIYDYYGVWRETQHTVDLGFDLSAIVGIHIKLRIGYYK